MAFLKLALLVTLVYTINAQGTLFNNAASSNLQFTNGASVGGDTFEVNNVAAASNVNVGTGGLDNGFGAQTSGGVFYDSQAINADNNFDVADANNMNDGSIGAFRMNNFGAGNSMAAQGFSNGMMSINADVDNTRMMSGAGLNAAAFGADGYETQGYIRRTVQVPTVQSVNVLRRYPVRKSGIMSVLRPRNVARTQMVPTVRQMRVAQPGSVQVVRQVPVNVMRNLQTVHDVPVRTMHRVPVMGSVPVAQRGYINTLQKRLLPAVVSTQTRGTVRYFNN